MHTELIDLLYENEAVEGVALFKDTGDLLESHLALSESSVIQICASLVSMKFGLAEASRAMKGFVIKTEKYTLQAYIYKDLLILLQVNPSYALDKTYLKIQSQLGDQAKSPAALPRNSGVTITESDVATTENVTIDEPMVQWADFKQKLATLIKRVAPSGVANKMIAASATAVGVSDEIGQIPLETAIKVGQDVVAKIPNASRRKLIEKEYNILAQQYIDTTN
ncbi:MAG: hypothetical protein ACSHX0_03415 [Akkermansiaceae bacterium]